MNQESKNDTFWEDLYQRLQELIATGKHLECHKELETLNPKKIPRVHAYSFGELAFRIHFHLFSLKVMHRFIHPETPFEDPASDKEKMIYASALYSLGSIQESLALLNTIDPINEPESLFFKALAGFYDWNYKDGVTFLENFITFPTITPYRRLLGKINLAAAYVSIQDWSSADALLGELKKECAQSDAKSFLGYCYEIEAQSKFFRGLYDESINDLLKSKSLLEAQGGVYLFFVEKWILIARLMKTRAPEELKELMQFRQQALKMNQWDTIRECDLFEAIACRNFTLIRKVIFGSPSEDYRRRARQLYTENIKPLGRFMWEIRPVDYAGDDPLEVFDPYAEKLFKKAILLQVFQALTQDFYKPFTLGNLFQRVFPEEKFNPFSSPPRLLQLLKRLNSWFIEENIPLRVSFKKSEFKLISLKPIAVVVHRGKDLSSDDGRFQELKTHFAQKSFTTSEVAKTLMISKFTVQKLLNAALQDGRIERSGKGRDIRYRFIAKG